MTRLWTRILAALLAAAMLTPLGFSGGCSTTRALAPLEKGQHGATISLGGPFVQYGGAPIPLPLSSVGYRYGIDGKSDFHTSFYVTQLALFKVGGFDFGFNRELISAKGARPRLMLDTTQHLFFGDRSPGAPDGGTRWFPEISAVATWDLGKPDRPHRIFVGASGFFQFFPEVRGYLTPMIGTELRAHRKLGIVLELDWMAPWVDTTYLNPVWYGVGDKGALAFKLGFNIYVPRGPKALARAGEAAPAPQAPPADDDVDAVPAEEAAE
jgi:hypothetical protein